MFNIEDEQNSEMMKDIFNIEDEQIPEMNGEEFITETKKLLKNIETAYFSCYTNRRLSDEELSKANCDDCNGKCVINDLECFCDNYEGECFIKYFDHNLFKEEIENIMFHDKNYFYELINCKINL